MGRACGLEEAHGIRTKKINTMLFNRADGRRKGGGGYFYPVMEFANQPRYFAGLIFDLRTILFDELHEIGEIYG